MKLPNRFGSVTKLSGNRRSPYMVREGISGRQKVIGYAATREEALILLGKFNDNPWDITQKPLKLLDLFTLWLEKRSHKLGKSNIHSLKSAWNHCQHLGEMLFSTIKPYHMQECIDGCGLGYSSQSAIKNLFHHLEKLAMELDISNKNYATLLTIDTISPKEKTVFSEEERNILWKQQDEPWIDTILIFLYTGFRISELLDIKKSQVDLEKQTITGGCKTVAGKNRVIPIHSKIKSIILKRMSQDGDYLLCHKGQKCSQQWYRGIWRGVMERFGMNHTPHECRHTFRSLLDTAGANPVCIDRLMGHSSQGTGQRIYTHKTIEELRENLELVTR